MMNGLKGNKWYGIGIALLILMAFVSLCVEPAENVDHNVTPLQPTPFQPTMTTTQPPPDTPVNDNGVVSMLPTRIREYFCSEYPKSCAVAYSLDILAIDSGWLAEKVYGALPVETYAHFTTPPARKAFIYWNDVTYAMPEEFNKFTKDSGIMIPTIADARGIADLYVKVWESTGIPGQPALLVLDNSENIPHENNAVPVELAGMIQSPEVSETADGYTVKVYSWTSVGGVVRVWDMTVSKSGEVLATDRIIGELVGDAIASA